MSPQLQDYIERLQIDLLKCYGLVLYTSRFLNTNKDKGYKLWGSQEWNPGQLLGRQLR